MNSMTYVIYSHEVDYCILVDCGEYETLRPVLNQLGKPVKAVLLTHGHLDHIKGLEGLLQEEPNVVIYSNEYGHVEMGDSKKNHSHYIGCPDGTGDRY